MIVWIAHAKVGHRQAPFPTPKPAPAGFGASGVRLAVAGAAVQPVESGQPVRGRSFVVPQSLPASLSTSSLVGEARPLGIHRTSAARAAFFAWLVWIALIGAEIGYHARISEQPPVHDAATYVRKAQNFW